MKRLRASSTIVAGLLFLGTFLASAAVAHRAYNGWHTVWSDGPRCVNEKVSLNHLNSGDDTGGRFWTEIGVEKETNTIFGTVNCNQGWNRPVNYIRAKVIALKLSGGSWAICFDSGYRYNNTDAVGLTVTAGTTGGRAPCGAGYYRTQGAGHSQINGGWRGGSLVIPAGERHYLPCAEGQQC